jgi:hypothetical protein
MSVNMISRSASIFAGHQGAELVVVAERGADLGRADAVVLIEHRDHAQVQQRLDRVAEVEIGLAVGQHLRGQQHLGDLHPLLLERLAGLPHQRGWPIAAQACRIFISLGFSARPSCPAPCRWPRW